VSSSSFEQLPELADKLRTRYNVDRDVLREILFQNALDEGELDNELEQLYPDVDVEDARQLTSVADFPNYIPFEGYDIDPDNETLNAYRLAGESPKAREFVEQNNDLDSLLPGGNVESARTAYLQAINSGALTPQQREALRYAGESRFLSDANYRSDAGEALNNLLQAYRDRYDVDYSQNLENVADILEQADEVIRPVEVGLGARDTMMRYADSDTVTRDPLANRINQNTIQPGLPLRGRDPGVTERYEEIRNNPPQTIEELNAQTAEIRALRQAIGREGNINTFPIEGSALLPQVADAIAPSALDRPARREVVLRGAEQQARNPNRNTLYQLQRDLNQEAEPSLRSLAEEAQLMRRTVNMSPAEIDPLIPTVTTTDSLQFGIPGLENQLLETREIARQEAVNKQAKELNKFVEKYPEVGPYLQGFLDNPTPKIERNLEKLSPYLDLEQEISKPEARQNIYNLAMKELGVQPSYLSQIELDYTSGETGKQKEAVDRLIQLGYGEQLQAGSAPAVSRRMPVVGGEATLKVENFKMLYRS
jgi:hypothetical protein